MESSASQLGLTLLDLFISPGAQKKSLTKVVVKTCANFVQSSLENNHLFAKFQHKSDFAIL